MAQKQKQPADERELRRLKRAVKKLEALSERSAELDAARVKKAQKELAPPTSGRKLASCKCRCTCGKGAGGRDAKGEEGFRLIPLRKFSEKYDWVVKKFFGTGSRRAVVRSVHEVRNKRLEERFDNRGAPPRSTEAWAFHGTHGGNIESICQKGFDCARSRCTPKHIWFAREASYSMPYCISGGARGGSLFMFLSRVHRPPPSKVLTGAWYHDAVTIGRNQDALPVYVIEFRKTRSPGGWTL